MKENQNPARGLRGHIELLVVALVILTSSISVLAQTPTVTFSPYLGATLAAVDSQTNVYANSNATIFTLNGSLIPIGTNNIATTNSVKFVQRHHDGAPGQSN